MLTSSQNGAKPAKFLPELTGYICSYRNGTGNTRFWDGCKPEYLILWRDKP
jgi:hypothetical protein